MEELITQANNLISTATVHLRKTSKCLTQLRKPCEDALFIAHRALYVAINNRIPGIPGRLDDFTCKQIVVNNLDLAVDHLNSALNQK